MPALFIDTERLRDLNSGLGQVCLHLGSELIRQQPADGSFRLTFGVPKGQTGLFGDQVSYHTTGWVDRIVSKPYDVWHALHQDAHLPPANPLSGKKAKIVLTVHDLNFLDRPDYSDAKKRRKLAQLQQKINRAAVVTAISEYTAGVVRQHLTLRPDQRLKVIYNGLNQRPANTSAPDFSPPFGEQLGNTPFFLFLGVVHPKKNCHVLLPLLQAFPDYKLVIAGDDSHDYAQHIREQAQKIGVAGQLLMTGPISEDTKWWLYEHCEAFLFPSLTEGFGLPVIEAMSLGKPVFLSNRTSLPEIGGFEAVFWENFEPDYMVETFRQGMMAYYDDTLKADRLRWQAKRFSWEKAARAYWEVYKGLIG
ncbi:glycosyltransferase family 4 protein [Arsenicibacter rosenii]|uniref:Glycosyl transferase family 1 n=1 Tax=Arsenicibacter rosenii TaxID=1750698 RepID=A0A1S2VNW5_9BACT|nr:glycosyltransferase family 1 protein [Arsenicibacter rosenii]OIN60434.1 glycosyl transferase family 1 [Arsenicibacter rosenii]